MKEETKMKAEFKTTTMKLGTAIHRYSLKTSALFQAYLSWNTYSKKPCQT